MELKGKAMGTTFAFAALGMTIAPVVGGVLTQYLSWNWIFYINIPIGIFAILLGCKGHPGIGVSRKPAPGFDRAGAVLIGLGLAYPALCPVGRAVGRVDRSGDPRMPGRRDLSRFAPSSGANLPLPTRCSTCASYSREISS